ncbi:MAG: flagellar biosynthesis anti-sigma factor FlgM [Phycisphaerales bacterium]|nr:flagellar biosynthesis anti-sigma factor FlgM [Phycisphaerales bacterium]
MSPITLSSPTTTGSTIRPEIGVRQTSIEAPGRGAGIEARGADRVDLSDLARRLGEIRGESAQNEQQPIRLDLVQRVRESIANGEYESPLKIAIAADALARRAVDVQG